MHAVGVFRLRGLVVVSWGLHPRDGKVMTMDTYMHMRWLSRHVYHVLSKVACFLHYVLAGPGKTCRDGMCSRPEASEKYLHTLGTYVER